MTALMLAACASADDHRGSPSPPPDAIAGAGRMFSPADDGSHAWLRAGDTARLLIPDPLAPDPIVEGNAIAFIAVANIAPSGQREWEIRAVRPGKSVIRATGGPRFTLTFEVLP
ncbi:hypothetical protein HNQ58_001204 [Rehaibacterium terrae]|uniref:Uncharacterized protein n=2 Tax=Rehaibacterium terrae TaxID=1341696 RepID=A0A7W8DDR3_9GAMM|nr:hypothetical protein [Rehaibacterium terrae]